jgi:uncharacterized protein
VETYTVNHQQWRPGLQTPYMITRIAIDGAPGVFLTSNVVNCPAEEIGFGDRVRVDLREAAR